MVHVGLRKPFGMYMYTLLNSPSQTMGLTKFTPNVTGLIVSFFLAVMCILYSRFLFQVKANKVAKSQFVYFPIQA